MYATELGKRLNNWYIYSRTPQYVEMATCFLLTGGGCSNSLLKSCKFSQDECVVVADNNPVNRFFGS